MAVEHTLSIIKPDAVAKRAIGEILATFEQAGLSVVATKMKRLTRAEAEAFYAVHADRPFYAPLVEFMLSGPVVISVLSGENAVMHHRQLIGATDPASAAPGTIRARFASNTRENAVHGSDSVENAQNEITFFFAQTELCH